MEQREIKVRRSRARFVSLPSFSTFPPVFCSFAQICLLVISPVTFCYGCFCFFFFTVSSLIGWGGGARPSLLSSSPSLLLHPLFSSSAVYFSGEYSAGRPALSAFVSSVALNGNTV